LKGTLGHHWKWSEEFKTRVKGRCFSEQHRNKLSEAKRRNPVQFWVGKKRDKETKEKMEKTMFKKGHVPWNKGIKGLTPWNKGVSTSEVTKKKISKSVTEAMLQSEVLQKISGENSPHWRGGSSFEPYPIIFNGRLKEDIRRRDNYTCQLCGVRQDQLTGRFLKLNIHHIDYNKNNCDSNNLVSVCHRCNVRINHKRDFWQSKFGGKMYV